ncbi:MAG TPA: hypothetical protein VGF95_08605 [Solirubrobacteraceae bacterium]|jgi:hypothetical protein
MRIAIDIDSTLHHHWDVLSEVSRQRFGIELPYEEQVSWGITRLREDQLQLCIEESHSDARILAGHPYPGAVETVCRWHREGHVVYVVSSREERMRPATERWLQAIGLPFERLHCCPEKVLRCSEERVELLIDDSPSDLSHAAELGIAVAAILHPWNEELCEEEGLLAARDWAQLSAALETLLTANCDASKQGALAG